MSDQERRQAPRKKTDVALEVYDADGQLIVGVGRLNDVSILGGRFTSQAALTKDQPVRVQFRVEEDILELKSHVIWIEKKGTQNAYGVTFDHPTAGQLKRLQDWMAKHPEAIRSSKQKTSYTIGLLPGDGVGPECLREGMKVLKVVAAKKGLNINTVVFDFGGERYLKTGEILPDSAIEEFRKLDAIFLGAIGNPNVKPGILEQGLLLKLRFSLDQYINLRPVTLFPGVWSPLKDKGPEHIDFVVVRENTEGAYVGMGGFFKKGTPDEVAQQIDINTRKGVERCIRYAFDYCRRRDKRKKLTMVDKANVLTYGHDLWTRTFAEVGQEYPDVEKDHAFVDATCMWFVKNPEWFDVLVTNNMFGDIITDLGAMIQGGLGVAAGGNINPHGVSMFEPIHGSAPKYAGKNVINPIATIAAGAMMLDTLGLTDAAQTIERAIRKVLSSGQIPSMDAGKMGMSTSQVGDLIAKNI